MDTQNLLSEIEQRILAELAAPEVRWLDGLELALRTGLYRNLVKSALAELRRRQLVTAHSPAIGQPASWSITTLGRQEHLSGHQLRLAS